MKRKHLFTTILGISIVWIITGCANLNQSESLPTLIPTEYLPTVIAATARALVTQVLPQTQETQQATEEPTVEATFTKEVLVPNNPELATPTPTIYAASENIKTEIPYAELQFISPGELSRIISPINLHAYLIPGDSGRARIELLGEDGRLMYRKLFVFSNPTTIQINLRTEIDFEIKGVAETATLLIRTEDNYGRVKAITSEDLILLALGESEINPAGDLLAPIIIQEPSSKTLIQGDTLIVSGLVRTSSALPLLVELINTEGKVIGNRLAGITPGFEGKHRPFITELNYQVDSPTWVRITVSEWNKWQTGPAQLTSREVLLSP